jgi:hypothetical protein
MLPLASLSLPFPHHETLLPLHTQPLQNDLSSLLFALTITWQPRRTENLYRQCHRWLRLLLLPLLLLLFLKSLRLHQDEVVERSRYEDEEPQGKCG